MRRRFRYSALAVAAMALGLGAPASQAQLFGGARSGPKPAPINSGERVNVHNPSNGQPIPIEVGGVLLTRLGGDDRKVAGRYTDVYLLQATKGEHLVVSIRSDRPVQFAVRQMGGFALRTVADNYSSGATEIAGVIPRTGPFMLMVQGVESGAETDYDLTLHSNLRPLGAAADTSRREAPVAASAAPSPEALAYAAGKPEPLRPYYAALYADGEHNAVLNFQRLGLAAIETGHFDRAEWAFDEALARIETIYAKDGAAKKARSLFARESIKDFKGEPYERAMAYYYRGLLYLREGDYENARASFLAGEYQDTLSEAEEFQGDFAALIWLAGWASQCAGSPDMAQDQFALARRFEPRLQAPAPDANLLVIAEVGTGPIKVRGGSEDQLLRFARPARTSADDVRVAIEPGGDVSLVPASSVHHQATTRGGRAIDHVLNGKASVRAVVNSTLFGMGTGAGNLVQTEADIRMWDTLPDAIMLGTAAAPASFDQRFSYSLKGRPVEGELPAFEASAGRCALAWSRSSSALTAGAGAPGNDLRVVAARDRLDAARAQDRAFREQLEGAE